MNEQVCAHSECVVRGHCEINGILKSRFSYAQDLGSRVSPAAERVLYQKALRPVSRSGGLAPTASGANSIASALGTPPGATPAELCQHSTRILENPPKPELSTLAALGTFYFGVTHSPSLNHLWPRPGGSSLAPLYYSSWVKTNSTTETPPQEIWARHLGSYFPSCIFIALTIVCALLSHDQ